jgi:hypothetical protein
MSWGRDKRSSTMNQPKLPDRDRQRWQAFGVAARTSSQESMASRFQERLNLGCSGRRKNIGLPSKHHSTYQALRFQDLARSDARPQSITSSHPLHDTVRLPTTVVRSEDLPSNTSAPRSPFSTPGRQELIYRKVGKPGFYFVEMVVSKVSGFMRTGIQDVERGGKEVDVRSGSMEKGFRIVVRGRFLPVCSCHMR